MTDVENFDISLFVKVINAKLESLDYSQRPAVVKKEIECFRSFANKLRKHGKWFYHKPNRDLSGPKFEGMWG